MNCSHCSESWACAINLHGGRCAPSIARVCRRREAIDPNEPTVFQINIIARPLKSIDRGQWPLLVRAIARLESSEDVGVGDTLKRVIGKVGELRDAMTNGCSACSDRRAYLNAKFPYARGSAG